MDCATRKCIEDILASRSDMTLATLRSDGYPQANIVSYASDGLALYFGTGRDSQKVKNLRHSDKVSVTVNTPYANWNEIRGLSIAGTAQILGDGSVDEWRAAELLLGKFPVDVQQVSSPPDQVAIVFVKILPELISVVDYRKGFGHTELVTVEPVRATV